MRIPREERLEHRMEGGDQGCVSGILFSCAGVEGSYQQVREKSWIKCFRNRLRATDKTRLGPELQAVGSYHCL